MSGALMWSRFTEQLSGWVGVDQPGVRVGQVSERLSHASSTTTLTSTRCVVLQRDGNIGHLSLGSL